MQCTPPEIWKRHAALVVIHARNTSMKISQSRKYESQYCLAVNLRTMKFTRKELNESNGDLEGTATCNHRSDSSDKKRNRIVRWDPDNDWLHSIEWVVSVRFNILHQNSALCHTSMRTKYWLSEIFCDHITVKIWLPDSEDFSPLNCYMPGVIKQETNKTSKMNWS